MAKKNYYTYDLTTDSYRLVEPTRGQRLLRLLPYVFGVLCLVAAIIAIAVSSSEQPKEDNLKDENKRLKTRLSDLSKRMDGALTVMDAVIDRDNNFYRVMLQAEPISEARRYAGLEREMTLSHYQGMGEGALADLVDDKIRLLERQMYTQIQSFDSLRILAEQHHDRMMRLPSIQPISSNDLKRMASGYGMRIDPVYGTSKMHEGMDFASDIGTPVYATADGVVTEAGWNDGGYGNKIDIDHGFNYSTRYAHLNEILVSRGQQIKRGDLIGFVGNTGKSTGPHLHYEVRYRGEAVDPVNYYFQDLTPAQYEAMVKEAKESSHVMD